MVGYLKVEKWLESGPIRFFGENDGVLELMGEVNPD